MKHYLWLSVFFTLTVWLTFTVEWWPQNWLILVEFSPFVFGAIALFVSIWLNRIRPMLVVLCIVLANLAFAYFAPVAQESVMTSVLFPLISFLLPLNLFLWVLLPEKGVTNRSYNVFVISVISLQLVFLYWFMKELPLQWVEELSRPIAPNLEYIHLPFMGAFTFLIAGFAISLRLQKQQQLKIFDHSTLFILLLMGFALNQHNMPGVFQLVSMLSIIIVMLTMVFDAHHIAYTDELTGLKNRRALNEHLMSLGNKYAIVMIDIDFFKQFNDSYGHDLGDEVLRMVASILNSVKLGGKAFRFGGEEFTLVFKYKQVNEIENELQRLRMAVEDEQIEVMLTPNKKAIKNQPKSRMVNVTISLGASQCSKQCSDANKVLKQADQGLYQAKDKGRNCLVINHNQPESSRKKTK